MERTKQKPTLFVQHASVKNKKLESKEFERDLPSRISI